MLAQVYTTYQIKLFISSILHNVGPLLCQLWHYFTDFKIINSTDIIVGPALDQHWTANGEPSASDTTKSQRWTNVVMLSGMMVDQK